MRNSRLRPRYLFILGILISAAANISTAQTRDPLYEYGKHLASTCAACHVDRTSGAARRSGIPDIWELPFAEFKQKFFDIKKKSANPAVRMTVSALTEEDVKAILHYFERRERDKSAIAPPS